MASELSGWTMGPWGPTCSCSLHKGCSNITINHLVEEGGKQLLSTRVTWAIFNSKSDNLNEQCETADGLALPILQRTISDQILQVRIKPTRYK